MLKSSRTWPSIITMAVVQLKFDQRGKYSYSTIADINQSHKQQLIEDTGSDLPRDVKPQSLVSHNGDHKTDILTRISVKSDLVAAVKGRQSNGIHNGGSINCTSPSRNGKVCLCELDFHERRKRSESIKVENWDFIYKERALRASLSPLDQEDCNLQPK